jgi:FdhE protein
VRRFHEADCEESIQRWLDGAELPSVDGYLARASASPLLEEFRSRIPPAPDSARDERHCPACGGLPQLAYVEISGEALVAAPRRLLCSRCAQSWIYPRLVCAGCGSEDAARLPIYADSERFAGLRIDACETCRRYLVTVDLPKDPAAVPVVDELAAVPLDLYARERGFQKITPNLMAV